MDKKEEEIKEIKENKEEPKEKDKIKHIVINGGGPLLLNMYGALKQANQLKIWNHEDIKSYYGTSAGAILGTIMALKYDWSELDNYIINRPWQHVLKFNVLEIYDYYANNGITDQKFIYEIFSPLFKAKDIDVNVDMATFRDITGTSLYFYATELSSFNVKEFSADATPTIKVLDAVYASSALPILLKPIEIDGNIYIDGSVYMNYPIAKCIERNGELNTILGIKNVWPKKQILKMENMNMFNYLSHTMNMLFIKSQTQELCADKEQILEIKISSQIEDLSNFFKMASSSEERKRAIDRGIADTNAI